ASRRAGVRDRADEERAAVRGGIHAVPPLDRRPGGGRARSRSRGRCCDARPTAAGFMLSPLSTGGQATLARFGFTPVGLPSPRRAREVDAEPARPWPPRDG